MPLVKIPLNNFSRGELDPELAARTDLKIYAQGGQTVRNVALRPQGGLRRRPSMQYLADIATPDCRLAEYVFSEGQEYVFAFLNTQLKVYNLSGSLLTTVNSCPWTTSQLSRLTWASAYDTTIVCHPDMKPQKILRTGASSFTVGDLTYENYDSPNVPGWIVTFLPTYRWAAVGITLTPNNNLAGSGRTLTASAAYFSAGMVNHYLRFRGKMVQITAFTDSTHVTATIFADLPDNKANADWEEEAFDATHGYPSCAIFHEQRLILAGHKSVPDGWWGSKVGGYFNFDTGDALDSDAIQAAMGAERVNEIRYMVSSRHLQFFTDQGPFYIPTTETRPLTPTNCGARRQAPYGVARIRPREFDGGTLYVQKKSEVLRDFVYDDTVAAYGANQANLLSSHLISSPVDMAVAFGGVDSSGQAQPSSFALVLNGDGTLAEYQAIRDEQIAGWTLWTTSGQVLSICAVDNDVFLLVKRVINGANKYWLEKLDWFEVRTLDSYVLLSNGSPITSWSGLSRFNGHTVRLVAWNTAWPGNENVDLGDAVVSGGSVTTPIAVTELLVGLNYTPTIQPMPVDAQLQDGPVSGELRHINRVVLKVSNTNSIAVEGEELVVRQVDDDPSMPVNHISGSYEVFPLLDWERDPTLTISQTAAVRMNLKGVKLEVEV